MKLAGMPLRQSIETYVAVRPVGLRGGLRLLAAFARSGIEALARPSEFASVGHFIPGRAPMLVRLGGITAEIRPRTADLGLLAAATEPRAARWFQVRPGDVVIDVGAQIGRYTLLGAKVASRVLAIEPEPSNYAVLVRNVERNGFRNVETLPVALAEREGEGSLFVPSRGDTGRPSLDASWSPREGSRADERPIPVRLETLDHVADSHGVDRVDWLKIDVEGTEVQVLRGGPRTLSRAAHVILEVTHGHETECRGLTQAAGLSLSEVERAEGARTENWLLTRDEPAPAASRRAA